MSEYANKKRREIEYQVDGQVFLKLCPYWQLSVQTGISPKLSPRFYRPFLITTRPPEARIHPVFHVSQLKKVSSGFWIGGFGLGESMLERPALLEAVMDSLPEEKPRLICGLGLPEEVLQGVATGVDLFDSSYIYNLTLGGFALTFPLDRIETNASGFQSTDMGVDQTKINLKATVYRKDTSPIVASCTCYTCLNHTKAYINHLLNVHEMLAQTLLEIHNTHHYLGFFRSIREAIKDGKFEQFRQMFIQRRRDNIAAVAVCA
uniref:tRNA-guanine(15) transglycosylase-like domain-containing protein n=1 Tax=Manihot esculenta TaxID=3983 RepID=A0A2C9U2W4_MANES